MYPEGFKCAKNKMYLKIGGCKGREREIESILLKDLYALSIAVVYYLKITDKDIQ